MEDFRGVTHAQQCGRNYKRPFCNDLFGGLIETYLQTHLQPTPWAFNMCLRYDITAYNCERFVCISVSDTLQCILLALEKSSDWDQRLEVKIAETLRIANILSFPEVLEVSCILIEVPKWSTPRSMSDHFSQQQHFWRIRGETVQSVGYPCFGTL